MQSRFRDLGFRVLGIQGCRVLGQAFWLRLRGDRVVGI